MKKTLLGLAFIAMAAISLPAAAQTDTQQVCPVNAECTAHKRPAKKNGECKECPFATLNLTAEQKAKVEALNNALKVSRKELNTQCKVAREKGDTACNRRVKSKEIRTKYLKDLSEILNSDQYIAYLQNFYINAAPSHHKGMHKRISPDLKKGNGAGRHHAMRGSK